MEKKTFRLRVIVVFQEEKDKTEITGYNQNSCYAEIDVVAGNLYQAVAIFRGKYKDENKYRIDYDNCKLVLPSMNLYEL
jgi:hypothetical protein